MPIYQSLEFRPKTGGLEEKVYIIYIMGFRLAVKSCSQEPDLEPLDALTRHGSTKKRANILDIIPPRSWHFEFLATI
jgi:hypothetical protein